MSRCLHKTGVLELAEPHRAGYFGTIPIEDAFPVRFHGHGLPKRSQPTPWWKAVWHLVVEIWVGSLLFAVLFTPAVLLDLAVKWLRANAQISEFLIALLTWTKYSIAVLDAALYLVFLLNMAWHFWNELHWGHTDHG